MKKLLISYHCPLFCFIRRPAMSRYSITIILITLLSLFATQLQATNATNLQSLVKKVCKQFEEATDVDTLEIGEYTFATLTQNNVIVMKPVGLRDYRDEKDDLVVVYGIEMGGFSETTKVCLWSERRGNRVFSLSGSTNKAMRRYAALYVFNTSFNDILDDITRTLRERYNIIAGAWDSPAKKVIENCSFGLIGDSNSYVLYTQEGYKVTFGYLIKAEFVENIVGHDIKYGAQRFLGR